MPSENPSDSSDLARANARLAGSIKSCRSMIANYKALLAGEQVEGADEKAGCATGRPMGVPDSEPAERRSSLGAG